MEFSNDVTKEEFSFPGGNGGLDFCFENREYNGIYENQGFPNYHLDHNVDNLDNFPLPAKDIFDNMPFFGNEQKRFETDESCQIDNSEAVEELDEILYSTILEEFHIKTVNFQDQENIDSSQTFDIDFYEEASGHSDEITKLPEVLEIISPPSPKENFSFQRKSLRIRNIPPPEKTTKAPRRIIGDETLANEKVEGIIRKKGQENGQKICCFKKCSKEVSETKRLRFSLKIALMKELNFSQVLIGHDKICHTHYFSDRYKHKKLEKKEIK